MSIRITRSTDRIEIRTVTIMIYGSPGLGKTSLAFTADAPLLLDFDRGSHRSGFRKDTVQVENWADVAQMTAADLADFRTIVVDTVGRCLDMMSADIIARNPKMSGHGGALSLQGYGALKAAYATWLGTLASMGKDIVLIAHDREDKKGDNLIFRADIQGASHGEVFKRADGVGYMYRDGRQTILDFSPTDRWHGKNAANFEPLVVPDFHQQGDYLATVIADTKAALNKMSEAQTLLVAEISTWQQRAEDATTAAEINALLREAAVLTPPVGPQAKAAVVGRAKALGMEWRTKGKGGTFVDAAPSSDAEPTGDAA